MKKPTCLILTGIGVLLLVVVLIIAVPWFMNAFEEVQQIGDKQSVYKRELRQFANKPLISDRKLLLERLIEIAGETSDRQNSDRQNGDRQNGVSQNGDSQSGENLENVLSSSPYISFINTHAADQTYQDYPTYLAAMPTARHREAVKSRLINLIGTAAEPEQLEIWTDYYYIMREWSRAGKSILTDRKEFDELLQTHLVNPLMENTGLEGVTSNIVKMGLISGFIIEDNEVLHYAWYSRVQSYGFQEGYLRCAIATPIEFALMRSFFTDAAAFEKWLSEPHLAKNKVEEEEPVEVEEQQQ